MVVGSPSKKLMKAQTFRLLKRKKQYECQAERLRNQSLHMKQAIFVAQRRQRLANEKSQAELQIKKKNEMSEKLRLLYKKVVKQSK